MIINWPSSFPHGEKPEIVNQETNRNNFVEQPFLEHDQTKERYDSLLNGLNNVPINRMTPGFNDTQRRVAIGENLKSKFNSEFPLF